MKWKYKNQIGNFLTVASSSSEGEIWVYGDIADSKTYEDDVTPITIRDSLNEIGSVRTLNLRINSYGGSTVAGNSIIDIIDDYKKKTNAYTVAYIEGIAASMASGIAMVADKICMASNAMMMIHKPYTIVAGDVNDLQKTIDILSKTEDTLVKNYMRHFNGSEEQLRDLLADETWLTADEALAYGFCDEIIDAVQIAASAKGIVINGVEFQHETEKIAARFCPGTPIALHQENTFCSGNFTHPSDKTYLDAHFVNTIGTSDNSIPSNGITSIYNPNQFSNISCPPFSNINGSYINNQEVKPKVFVYDKKLQDYGISKEVFDTFNVESSTVISIIENAVIAPQNAMTEYMSADAVKNTLGKDMEVDEVLALAKAGMDIDQKTTEKAKAYDKLVNSAIEDAIKNGIRAKGESFNETKWKKLLNGLDYDEILDQSREWDEESKIALNAGKRVSEPVQNVGTSSEYVDPGKYSAFI